MSVSFLGMTINITVYIEKDIQEIPKSHKAHDQHSLTVKVITTQENLRKMPQPRGALKHRAAQCNNASRTEGTRRLKEV